MAVNLNGCSYCGYLDWTVKKYGRVTHKQSCPNRTVPWHQGDPHPAAARSYKYDEATDRFVPSSWWTPEPKTWWKVWGNSTNTAYESVARRMNMLRHWRMAGGGHADS